MVKAPAAALAAAGLLAVAFPVGAAAQDQEPEPVVAKAGFDPGEWLRAREPVPIRLSRAPAPGAGRLRVFLGRTDVTALTQLQGQDLIYRPAPLDVSAGETEVSVHLVSPDGEWQEIGRFPVRILDRAGFRQLDMAPTLELISDGDLDEGQELTANFGLGGTVARPGWIVRTRANAVAVTRDEQRLRFGERGLAAPAVDLSDYLVELESGPVAANIGHVSFGASRHLINGFASRGLSGGVAIGDAAHVGIAAMNGSSVVGWSNPFGLNSSDHRMMAGSLDLELLPSRPGLIHLGATVLDGSLLPRAGYSQGVVNDAETGSGIGLNVALSDPWQRARIGAGFTRATFTNPADPLLAQGGDIVPVRSTTRNARYLDASVQLLRRLEVSPGVPAMLSAGFRHERVDPLYRSIAAPAQSDIQRNVYEATGSLGQLTLQYSHGRSRDNLDDIESILTTLTREHAVTGALPLGALFRAPYEAWWWPMLSAGYQTVRQRGAGIPENGGFSESHVPDQASSNVTLSLGWQHAEWSVAYQHNASRQDNRQPGRENADFHARVNSVSFGVQPLEPLRVSLDLSEEQQHSIEFDQIQRTRRIGVSGDWRVFAQTMLQGNVAFTRTDDQPLTQRNENIELRLEASQGFDIYRHSEAGSQARAFLRYARSRIRLGGPAFGFPPAETVWSMTSGISLRLF